MRLQVGRIDHHRLWSSCLRGQTIHHPGEHSLVTPPFPTVVEGLRRTILPGCIAPPQTIAIDEDYAAKNATIIDAPSSTKNKAGARDPEMSSTKKGNDWYFGMKAHIGVDAASGVIHSLETSTAKVHDSQVWDQLLHGEETSVWADKGYVSAEREAIFTAQGKVWGVMRKAPKGGELAPLDERANRLIASVRARVEHPFRIIKCQFGHVKTRYRGLAKNRAQLFTLFALGNLFRKRCVSPVVSTWGDFGHAALQLSLQEFGDGAPK